MNGKHYIGKKVLSVQNYDSPPPISKVILWVDDENYYESGDDSGTVLEQDCPYATQAMANDLLQKLGGYEYHPISAEGARLSPLAELGDGVTVNGTYTMVAYQNIRFGPEKVADIAAPGSRETLHEYQTDGEIASTFNRKLATTRSLITKTAEEIRLEITNEVDGLASSISVSLDEIRLDVDDISVSITALEGLTVTDSSGVTRIKGSSVETGSLALTGCITWGDLAADTQSEIDGAYSAAQTAQNTASSAQTSANNASNLASTAYGLASNASNTVSGWTYPGSTYINGNMLMTGTVRASVLAGGTIQLLNASGGIAGSMTLAAATSGYSVDLSSGGGMRLAAGGGNLYLSSGYGTALYLTSGYIGTTGADLCCTGTAKYLGSPTYGMWQAVYAYTGTIQTSDRRLKSDIESLPEKYITMLDAIRPVRYKMANGTSGRFHVGFIAQEVEEAMAVAGVDSAEFGGWAKDKDGEGNDIYMLRYEEFIGLLLGKIRQMETRLAELEGNTHE